MAVQTRSFQGSDEQRQNGVNKRGPSATHDFICRYKQNDFTGKMLFFNGDFYEILGVTNLNNRNEFLKLRCRITGNQDQEAAEA
jgi:hypothetical protein